MTSNFETVAARESRVRRRARRNGYIVRKSRKRPSLNDGGQFMVVDADTRFPVIGHRYDATLDDVEAFFSQVG